MVFNSLTFLIFFTIVATIYFFLPYRFRWILLLIASCYFYMAFIPVYILILFATILIDYAAGILIETASGHRRKLFLVMSLITNIGILAFFKYYNFFLNNFTAVAQAIHWNYNPYFLSIILPIGLSFHTFQAMSYTLEVYKGKQKAERHLGIYALYVLFFPQLVAGPIERPQQLLPQFYDHHQFAYTRVTSGLKRIVWGFFKKVVVADHVALVVNQVFNHSHAYQGPELIFATVCFAVQLYADFSGYTDIALGSAEVFGIRLMENFQRPYFSKSIAEFWRRWHISLSSWLRDYVYFPLAFSAKKTSRFHLYRAVIITFFLSGLWHGAGWNYIFMGLLHGGYISFSTATKQYREKYINALGLHRTPNVLRLARVAITFGLVCIGWIFFRSSSATEAFYIILHLPSGIPHFIHNGLSYYTYKNLLTLDGALRKSDVLIVIFGIIVLITADVLERNKPLHEYLQAKPVLRWSVYYGAVLAILLFGVFGAQEFIYFQF